MAAGIDEPKALSAGDGPRTDDALRPAYFWEKKWFHRRVRKPETARACVSVMLQRIGLTKEERRSLASDPVTHKRLLAYGVEVHLNIAWYDHAKKRESLKRAGLISLILLFAVAGLAGMVAYAFLDEFVGRHGSGVPAPSNAAVFQISAFVGAAFAILRLIATLTSNQCRLGLFWRARSDIAEVLYLFEQKWQGQFATARLAELSADLDTGITAARHIARTERQQFFDSLISPADVLTSAQQAFAGVLGQAQTVPYPRPMQPATLPAPAVPVPPLSSGGAKPFNPETLPPPPTGRAG